MSDILPGAKYLPLSFIDRLDARVPRKAAIVHTNGGGAHLQPFFNQEFLNSGGSRVGAHVNVMRDGTIEQYVPFDLVIYHAYSASHFAVGIETEDDGDPKTLWTYPQVQGIITVLKHLEVPPTLLQEKASDGIGYHSQFTSWNQQAHDCPGSARERQLLSVLIPEYTQEVTNVALTKEDKDWITQQLILVAEFLAGKQNATYNNSTVGTPAPKFPQS